MSLSENRFPLFRDERALTPVFAGYALEDYLPSVRRHRFRAGAVAIFLLMEPNAFAVELSHHERCIAEFNIGVTFLLYLLMGKTHR